MDADFEQKLRDMRRADVEVARQHIVDLVPLMVGANKPDTGAEEILSDAYYVTMQGAATTDPGLQIDYDQAHNILQERLRTADIVINEPPQLPWYLRIGVVRRLPSFTVTTQTASLGMLETIVSSPIVDDEIVIEDDYDSQLMNLL